MKLKIKLTNNEEIEFNNVEIKDFHKYILDERAIYFKALNKIINFKYVMIVEEIKEELKDEVRK